ncbi:MAG TPA: NAD-dependent succinate-semialdehyde dehydrogenase [Methanotrichaceae archaeon]|nr:NAD-dependent succinate-semialdehyde dehydrogenase [Methanotrichaceae archaeon]
MHKSQMLINGELVASLSGKVEIIRNPANQEPVAEVSVGSREDARLALEAAKAAFPEWSRTTSALRADLLHEAARLVRKRSEDIARLLTMEMGKPLKGSRLEILASADTLDYYAEEGRRNFGQWITSSNSRSIVIRQPVGVCALITPWNFPVDLLAWKVGPALAAGCTLVAKPPSKAPLAATEFIKTVNEAGLPPGTVNAVHGPGSEVGAELVENPISRKIAFTGETSTGKWIMEKAAKYIKRVSLELGGQSPFIVCADADLEKAAAACAQRAFNNMGQICISVNRIYADEKVADEFTSRLLERTRRFKIGSGLENDVDLGPMASEAQRQKTKEHVADALQKGAKLLYGGSEPEGREYEKGFFFLPTVLSDANHSMKVMREETFGPVAPIMRFKTLDEALVLANDTEYGLAAYVFTESLKTAIYAAERLEAGGVGVNVNSVVDMQAPFGGWKQSGFGRELGHYGLESYMEIKHIRLGM